MGEFHHLTASDGHRFSAYVAAPEGPARAGVVVLQEIFGINAHMRAVTEEFAAEGYLAVAPSLFDRLRSGIELAHTPAGIEQGIGYAMQLRRDDLVADIRAAVEHAGQAGRVGVVGYCFGGFLARLAASHVSLACAVSYYGGNIPSLLESRAQCPMLYHFAERDKYVPLSDVEQVRRAQPEDPVYLYPAEHGFGSDDRPEYDPACAALARGRTLAFLERHLRASPAAA